eukprot:TRINITY_DN21924_c0_g1_i1.p1 TRINITY_DN21924_c0_g1~~TRINITY_DN21924_c0_g1_i1.p1  ORF type:complete len:253 (-),score=-2.53 TRINITY_DN21924_c0_g1_i1:70-828(-)
MRRRKAPTPLVFQTNDIVSRILSFFSLDTILSADMMLVHSRWSQNVQIERQRFHRLQEYALKFRCASCKSDAWCWAMVSSSLVADTAQEIGLASDQPGGVGGTCRMPDSREGGAYVLLSAGPELEKIGATRIPLTGGKIVNRKTTRCMLKDIIKFSKEKQRVYPTDVLIKILQPLSKLGKGLEVWKEMWDEVLTEGSTTVKDTNVVFHVGVHVLGLFTAHPENAKAFFVVHFVIRRKSSPGLMLQKGGAKKS